MKGIRTLAVLLSLAAIAIAASDASAYYHPRLGRFLSRDPGPGGANRPGTTAPSAATHSFLPRDPTGTDQYADGMNLYQYGRSRPTVERDPMGTKVVVSCDQLKAVKDYLRQRRISGFTAKDMGEGNVELRDVAGISWRGLDKRSEILARMILDDRVFYMKNGSKAELKKHVEARMAVITAAREAVNLRYGDYSPPPEARAALRAQKFHEAYRLMWKGGANFSTGCVNAVFDAMLVGISRVMGPVGFDEALIAGGRRDVVAHSYSRKHTAGVNWIPGDWGHIRNNWGYDPTIGGSRFWREGGEGQNLLYLGGQEGFWGLAVTGGPVVKPLGWWVGGVSAMGGKEGGRYTLPEKATVLRWRRFPRVGLDPQRHRAYDPQVDY